MELTSQDSSRLLCLHTGAINFKRIFGIGNGGDRRFSFRDLCRLDSSDMRRGGNLLPEDVGRIFFRRFGKYRTDDRALRPKR
jgi:hypothetical protein